VCRMEKSFVRVINIHKFVFSIVMSDITRIFADISYEVKGICFILC